VAKVAAQGVPVVHEVLTSSEMWQQRIQNVVSGSALSFYPGRSGNLIYQLQPYHVLAEESTGADHGSPWAYDAHVPLLWFGTGVSPGSHPGAVSIADVAPTLSLILGIAQPGGTRGKVLEQMLH
jgi:hypothetical protein